MNALSEKAVPAACGVPDSWKKSYRAEFEALACAEDFPCIYVKQAYEKGYIDFHFMEDCQSEVERLKAFEAFKHYVGNVLATPDERVAAMKILLIVVNTDGVAGGHEQISWDLLNDFVRRDEIPWPEHLTRNPDDQDWAYCFQGQRLFVNLSSPEHLLRRSRNLGSRLVLVMQLRDGIDCIAPPNAKGDVIRQFIRQRINTYDQVPVSADLATHGQGQNRDWKQFWLGDREAVLEGTCPFHMPDNTAKA